MLSEAAVERSVGVVVLKVSASRTNADEPLVSPDATPLLGVPAAADWFPNASGNFAGVMHVPDVATERPHGMEPHVFVFSQLRSIQPMVSLHA